MDAERAIAASGLRQIPRAVAFDLLLCTDGPSCSAEVYVDTLVRRTGWSERIIRAALKLIEAAGLLIRTRTRGATIYRWSLEAIARLVRPSVVKAARKLDKAACEAANAKLRPRSPIPDDDASDTSSGDPPPPPTAPGGVDLSTPAQSPWCSTLRRAFAIARFNVHRIPIANAFDDASPVSSEVLARVAASFADRVDVAAGDDRAAAVELEMVRGLELWMRRRVGSTVRHPEGYLRHFQHPLQALPHDLPWILSELGEPRRAPTKERAAAPTADLELNRSASRSILSNLLAGVG